MRLLHPLWQWIQLFKAVCWHQLRLVRLSQFKVSSRPSRRLPLVVLLLWSSLLGLTWTQFSAAQTLAVQTLAQVPAQVLAQIPAQPPPNASSIPTNPTDTVDPVTDSYRLGQQFYLENCASCHVGLPPAVMPSQTWAALLPDSQHYGAQIKPLTEPLLSIVWNYVSTYSRPVLQNERIPFRLQQSRLFKALHPKVEFTEPVSVYSCEACHPAARQFNYRELSAEWRDGA